MKEEKRKKTERLKKELQYIIERNSNEEFLRAMITRAKILEKLICLSSRPRRNPGLFIFQIDCRSFFLQRLFHHHPKTNKP